MGTFFEIGTVMLFGRHNRLRTTEQAKICGISYKCFGVSWLVLDNGFERGTLL